jgi:hypothetical protein
MWFSNFLEKDNVFLTKRLTRCLNVLLNRSIWLVSPVSFPTALWCLLGSTFLYASQRRLLKPLVNPYPKLAISTISLQYVLQMTTSHRILNTISLFLQAVALSVVSRINGLHNVATTSLRFLWLGRAIPLRGSFSSIITTFLILILLLV